MKISLQVAFLLCLYVAVSEVSSQAPNDFNPACRQGNNAANKNFPDERRVLLDTYDYENIYDQATGTAVWRAAEFDGDSQSWLQVVGGACTWSLNTCVMPFGSEQDNWLFSQYINLEDANEILFDVSYRLSNCRDNPKCLDDFVTIYRYDVDGPVSGDKQTDPENYIPLQGADNEVASRIQQPPAPTRSVDATISLIRPEPRTNGFYLGFQDTGTCGQVNRLVMYYNVCPSRQSELVHYPRVATPPVGGSNGIFYAECVENAHNVTSLQVNAFSGNGTCRDVTQGGARCECNDGYQIDGDRLACEQCGVGTYRSVGVSSTCLDCPANTQTGATAASKCDCLDGFFRSKEDGPDTACTSPPGRVTGLSIVQADSTSITITWNRPALPGRNDFYYEVLIAETINLGVENVVEDMVVDGGATVTYTASGLKSFTNHTVTVVTHNGVSDQDEDSQAQRQAQMRAATTEGVPSVPLVNLLCTVVVWRPPLQPSGVITGYELRFEQSDDPDKVFKYDANSNFHITGDAQRSQNVLVEMRAMNTFASSPWTAPAPLNCTSQMNCNQQPATTSAPPTTTSAPPTTTSAPPATTSPGCQSKPPTFMLNDEEVKNGSALDLQMIEEDDDALLVMTEFKSCCRGEERMGECYYPNGTLVGIPNSGQIFYRNRGDQLIRLNRRPGDESTVYPLGFYRCELPDSCGVLTSIYVELRTSLMA